MFIPLHDTNPLRHIRLQYVTLAIIAINCLVWLVMAAAGLDGGENTRATFFTFGFIPAVANGYETLPADWALLPEPLTYISYAFVHGGFMHLAGNMLFIWVFGDNVEDAMGHLRFLVFFLACAVAGALMHSLIQPESVSPLVGASGAAAGIVAAYLMLHPRVKVWILALGRIPLRISAMWVIGAWIAFQVVNLLASTGEDEVSWGAHVGGLLAGAVLLPLFKRKGVPLFDREVVAVTPAAAEDDPALEKEIARAEAEVEAEDHAGSRSTEDSVVQDPPSEDPPMPWGRQPR